MRRCIVVTFLGFIRICIEHTRYNQEIVPNCETEKNDINARIIDINAHPASGCTTQGRLGGQDDAYCNFGLLLCIPFWSAVILLREYATAGQASEANSPLWAERSDGAGAPPSAPATTQHTSNQLAQCISAPALRAIPKRRFRSPHSKRG